MTAQMSFGRNIIAAKTHDRLPLLLQGKAHPERSEDARLYEFFKRRSLCRRGHVHQPPEE